MPSAYHRRFPIRSLLRPLCLLAPLALAGACSAVHGVRPIGKGAVQLDASLGGPITELFGAPVPLPISTIGATVGLTDRLDVHGAIHPTGLALFGIFAADAGLSYEGLAPDGARPRLMGDLTLIGAGGDLAEGAPEGGFRLFARPSLTASWDWGKSSQHTLYASVGGFIQPAPGPHALGTVALGNLWGIGHGSTFTTQVEWIAPYASSLTAAPLYYTPGNRGAISIQLGMGICLKGTK